MLIAMLQWSDGKWEIMFIYCNKIVCIIVITMQKYKELVVHSLSALNYFPVAALLFATDLSILKQQTVSILPHLSFVCTALHLR